MFLKSNIFRLSHYTYKFASKTKLNLFINIVLFLSIFAASLAIVSMHFENKINEIDKKIIQTKIQKMILENQISAVPSSINAIDIILDAQLNKESNEDILQDINAGGVMDLPLISARDKSFREYYDIITLVDISIIENYNYLESIKIIFNDSPEILKNLSLFEKIINSNSESIEDVYLKASKTEDDWVKYENENRISKNGYVGIFVDVVPEGLLIEDITEFSAAEKAGLKKGDIIISLKGKTFKNLKDRSDIEWVKLKPNVKAKFIIKRKNVLKDLIVIPTETFNEELYELKNTNYYYKFDEYLKIAKKALMDQKNLYLNFGIIFTNSNLEKININVVKYNKQLESLSKQESHAILIAFLIQLIIFISGQYFEFSLGQIDEKKRKKK